MKPQILIVEDDHNTLITLAYLIEHAGYGVTQAADGKRACDLLQSHQYNVVLTDIVLGEVSGIDVLLTARAQPYLPEVILLTGHGTLDTAMAAVNAGAFAYLLKPCVDSKLLAALQKAVNHHMSEQDIREAAAHLLDVLAQKQSTTTLSNNQTLPYHEGMRGSSHMLCVGHLLIGGTHHDVSINGVPIPLTPIEHALLSYLAHHAGKVCRYKDIIYSTHHLDTNNADAQILLAPHVRNLRKKLGASAIETARGTGYILALQSTEEP
jgi:DNA-binding response OmpR family regulator